MPTFNVTYVPPGEFAALDPLQRRRLYLNQCAQKGEVPRGSHAQGSGASARGSNASELHKFKKVVRDQAKQIEELQEDWDSHDEDLFVESGDESPKEANRNNDALVRYAPGTKSGSVRQTNRTKRRKK